MVKLCFTYRAEPNRTIETRRGISLELQTEDVYTELGTDPEMQVDVLKKALELQRW